MRWGRGFVGREDVFQNGHITLQAKKKLSEFINQHEKYEKTKIFNDVFGLVSYWIKRHCPGRSGW